MKNLDGLLTEAANAAVISDEAFNKLHNLITGSILPAYVVAMAALGHSQTYFSLPEAPFHYSNLEEDETGRITYPVMIDCSSSTIGNAHLNVQTGRYYPADDYYQRSFEDIYINKNALCALSIALIDTLDEAIRASSAATADAREIIDLFS